MKPDFQIAQLRALVAIDEARVQHLAAQLTGADGDLDAIAPFDPRHAPLCNRLGDTIRRLQRRRHALDQITRPSPATARPCAGVNAQPADLFPSHV